MPLEFLTRRFDQARCRVATMAVVSGAGALVYLAMGRIFPPRLSTATFLDAAFPFLPETVWIYSSLYPAVFLVAAALRAERFGRLIGEMLVVYGLAFAAFVLCQTESPRPSPMPALNGISGALYGLLISVDRTTNACPSLHICLAFLFCIQLAAQNPRWIVPSAAWTVLLAVSTLTTRQHTLVDIGGAIVAVLLARGLCRLWKARRH